MFVRSVIKYLPNKMLPKNGSIYHQFCYIQTQYSSTTNDNNTPKYEIPRGRLSSDMDPEYIDKVDKSPKPSTPGILVCKYFQIISLLY